MQGNDPRAGGVGGWGGNSSQRLTEIRIPACGLSSEARLFNADWCEQGYIDNGREPESLGRDLFLQPVEVQRMKKADLRLSMEVPRQAPYPCVE